MVKKKNRKKIERKKYAARINRHRMKKETKAATNYEIHDSIFRLES